MHISPDSASQEKNLSSGGHDVDSVSILGEIKPSYLRILTPKAIHFLSRLHEKFESVRETLLWRRQIVQSRIDAGIFPEFLPETRDLREREWTVASIPNELLDRRVEITGPVDRKMVINALNSGVQVYMADFEDSHSPTWEGTIEGQMNLQDAIRKTISYMSLDGKEYQLNNITAVLFVRPRGWHLVEKHFLINGRPISASLFDFGLYFFHNAHELIRRGTAPYFYLPKIESHLEARLWNDVFLFAEKELDISPGVIRATVLIENILAAFEMNEILYELRDHSAGLNCGRWDYIFSFIKKFRNFSSFVLPDRATVTMDVHFLKSYSQLLIQTCHRRGIHAMGGMAAQIPIKNNAAENAAAMAKVVADKVREVELGHDGTWVAHPGLVPVARGVFDEKMQTPNQIHRQLDQWCISASDLLKVPQGKVTEDGIRKNIHIAILYLESWLCGIGCVPLGNLMEDAATAEISRAQLWQWLKHGRIEIDSFKKIFSEEKAKIQAVIGKEKFQSGKYELAAQILVDVVTNSEFVEFITLQAYPYL